jgi:hypothetical protein
VPGAVGERVAQQLLALVGRPLQQLADDGGGRPVDQLDLPVDAALGRVVEEDPLTADLDVVPP